MSSQSLDIEENALITWAYSHPVVYQLLEHNKTNNKLPLNEGKTDRKMFSLKKSNHFFLSKPINNFSGLYILLKLPAKEPKYSKLDLDFKEHKLSLGYDVGICFGKDQAATRILEYLNAEKKTKC